MHLWRLLLWAFLSCLGPWAKGQDLSMCLESFDIHQDKIIRTQDSRAMGAKYINERDVPSREDCLRLCCETQDCDVFVFEEKMPGSCYLFQCGTPEDFKCKFTKHRNYTSAVLVLSRHLTELESQIKHTQHEHELARLRQPESEVASVVVSEAPHTSATEATGSKEAVPAVPTPSQFVQSRHCSRYQFECHSSGECIAIYNACDGIPQCSDGSDEAPELGCPAQVSTAPPLPKVQPASSIQHSDQQQSSSNSQQSFQQPPSSSQTDLAPMPVLGKQFNSNQWTPQMFESQHVPNSASTGYLQPVGSSSSNQQLGQQMPQTPPQLVNQVKQYGREGEGLMYRSPPQDILQQWQPSYNQEQLYRGNSGGSQIFSHKGSGLVAQSDSVTGQFDAMQPDYNRYNSYYEAAPSYHKVPQGWQPLHKPHGDVNGVGGVEENLNANMNLPVSNMNIPANNMPGQDYYYEESFRTRLQPQLLPQRLNPQNSVALPPETPKIKPNRKGEAEVETQEMIAETESKTDNSNSSVKKASAHHETVVTSTEKPKELHHHSEHHHNSHRKVETLSAELSLTENSFDSDGDGQNVSPRGAILSLTMGLCVTGIMLILVGCRMRMVRRRMRRGSKSPYAHDADFLVNGMYL